MTKELASDSSSGINCTTYDLTDAVPNKNDLPIGIVIPRSMNNNNSDENLAIESSVTSESDDVKLSKYFECLTHYIDVSLNISEINCVKEDTLINNESWMSPWLVTKLC